jgi:hypothetical protein
MGQCRFGLNPRESLPIGVHLGFHFLLRGQSGNRRRVTIVILGRSAPSGVPIRSGTLIEEPANLDGATIFANRYSRTDDRVLALVWLRQRARDAYPA